MIISLILLVIGIIISTAVWNCETLNIKNPNVWRKERVDSYIAVIVCLVMFFLIHAIGIGSSYDTYLDDRAFYSATSEQYFSAITVYKDHAVIDMGKAAFTDFKYQDYQKNISSFVTSLRNKIIDYNESIVKKRTMGKNPFFNWFVIEPDDDMVIMKMKVTNAKI